MPCWTRSEPPGSPRCSVFNKVDRRRSRTSRLLPGSSPPTASVVHSAPTGEGVDALVAAIAEGLRAHRPAGRALRALRTRRPDGRSAPEGEVLSEEAGDEGIGCVARLERRVGGPVREAMVVRPVTDQPAVPPAALSLRPIAPLAAMAAKPRVAWSTWRRHSVRPAPAGRRRGVGASGRRAGYPPSIGVARAAPWRQRLVRSPLRRRS